MSEKKKPSLQTPEEVAARQVEDRPPGTSLGPVVDVPPSGFGAGSEGGGADVWERVPDAPMPISAVKPKSLYEAAYPNPARGLDTWAARERVRRAPEAMPPHPAPVDRGPALRRVSWARRVLPLVGLFAAGAILPRLLAFRRGRGGGRLRGVLVRRALWGRVG